MGVSDFDSENDDDQAVDLGYQGPSCPRQAATLATL